MCSFSWIAGLALSLSSIAVPISAATVTLHATTHSGTTIATDSTVVASDSTRIAGSTANAAGLEFIALAEGEAPALSKDGKRVAFVRNNALFIMDLDSGRQRPILDLDNPRSVTWSSDGRRLAYQAGSFSIWLVNADGSRLRQLIAPAPGDGDQYPIWSPDGASLVWTHGTHLWIADTSGRNARPLTPNSKATFEVACDWSPDGQTILYSSALDYSDYQLRLIRRDRTEERPDPTGARAGYAQWSRDGGTIYFQDGGDICRMEHRSGGKTTRLLDACSNGGCLALAPDESFILHDCVSSKGPDQIFLVPLK